VIDPTDPEGQFVDKWFQYTTAIFVKDKAQQIKAEASLIAQSLSEKYDQSIVTKILPFTTFFPAEEYHQDYYIKAPQRYERYKDNSGRKEFFDQQTPEE
jgi:peptide methionine sulfoxide reductase MsrA